MNKKEEFFFDYLDCRLERVSSTQLKSSFVFINIIQMI